MKINIRKMSIIIFALVLGLSTTVVKAESGVTLTRRTYIKEHGQTEFIYYTNKGYAYCITPQKLAARQGHKFSYSNVENDGGLMYLLDRAGTSDYDYLITQLAIWKYKSNFKREKFNGTQYDVLSDKLVNQARKNSNYKGKTVSISATNINHQMNLTNDGKYYQSSFISINVKGSSQYKVKVTGSNYAQIITSTGKVINNNSNISSQEKIAIRIPAANLTSATRINVRITACGTKYIVKRYSPNNSSLQDIVLIDKERVCVNTSRTLEATPIKRTCEIYNGKYYDKNGKVTDKLTYEQECQTNICKQVGDKYFDKNGKVTDKLTYEEQCQTNICKQVGDKYFDKNGKVTDKLTYEQQCQTNICKQVGDKYFDKDGKLTDKLTYEQQCQTNICKQVGDKYFDKNGKTTDKLTYEQQCQTNICKQVGDKYFDKDGKLTDKLTYEQQCQTNICKQVGDKYFDNEGNIVSESEYKAKCEATTIIVPDTATNAGKTILSAILGILIISGTFIIIKKYNSNI